MTTDRPHRSSSAPSALRRHGKLGRMAAATAGAALGLGVLTVPALGAGNDTQTVGGDLSLAALDTAVPAVDLKTTSVAPGGQVTFSVSGFPAGGTPTVKLDRTIQLQQFTVADDGSFSGGVTLPSDLAAGSHTLYFLAPQTSVNASFTVTAPATAELGASSVKAGGSVPFSVAGFPAGQTLSVKLDDTDLLRQYTVGADGTFSGSVTIPSGTAAGSHWLRFLAPQTSVRSSALTVTAAPQTPTPTPAPTPARPAVRITAGAEVAAGGKVSFALSGFTKGQDVTVKLDDTNILAQWADAVGADGTFSGSVTVPSGTAKGAHWLRILAPEPPTSLRADFKVTSSEAGGSGGGSTTGSTTDSGTGSAGGGSGASTSGGSGFAATGGSGTTSSGPALSITSGSGAVAGGKVSFRLTGFQPGQRVTVKLDDEAILGQWENAVGADGTFSGSVTVPSGTVKGAHWLRILAPEPPTSLRAEFTVTEGAAAGSGTSGASGSSGTPGGGTAATVPAATGASASASNSRGAKAEITHTQVQPGGTLHFKVTKFPAGEKVTVKLDDDAILGQWDVNASGTYEGDVEIPADTSVGKHWLRFLAPNPPTTMKVDFTVIAPGSTASAGSTAPAAGSAQTAGNALVTADDSSVSYATVAWSAGAAAFGGALGAAATATFVLRRRTPSTAGAPAAETGAGADVKN